MGAVRGWFQAVIARRMLANMHENMQRHGARTRAGAFVFLLPQNRTQYRDYWHFMTDTYILPRMVQVVPPLTRQKFTLCVLGQYSRVVIVDAYPSPFLGRSNKAF
eukprot:scaffold8008_cov34-Tisochrysis_lutea.AAC.7